MTLCVCVASACVVWPFLAGFLLKIQFATKCAPLLHILLQKFVIYNFRFVSFGFILRWVQARPVQARLSLHLAETVAGLLGLFSDLIFVAVAVAWLPSSCWVHLFMPDSWHAIKITCAGMRPRSSRLAGPLPFFLPLALTLSACSGFDLLPGLFFLFCGSFFSLAVLPFKGCARVLVHLLCTGYFLYFLRCRSGYLCIFFFFGYLSRCLFKLI